jgi:hypothetical protein
MSKYLTVGKVKSNKQVALPHQTQEMDDGESIEHEPRVIHTPYILDHI